MFKTSTNKFLFNLALENPLYIFTSLILSLSSAILNVFSTTLLIPILAICLGNSQKLIIYSQSALIQYFLVFFERFNEPHQLVKIIAILITAIIFKNLINYINVVLGFKHIKYLIDRLKSQGILLLCKVNVNYYLDNKLEEILFKLNREIDRTILAIKSIQNIFIIAITIFALSLLLVSISWQLTLVVFALKTVTTYIIYFLDNLLKKTNILLVKQTKKSSQKLIELLSGIRLIKTIGNEKEEYKSIKYLIDSKERTKLNSQVITAITMPINEISGMIIILALIITSAYLYEQPVQEFAPTLLIYLAVLFRLLPFISQFNNARSQIYNNIYSVEVIADFLDEANKPIFKSGNIIFNKLQSDIKFKTVTFAYPHDAKVVLDKINLCIPQGKITALIGNSGAGKSTIIDIILRFYDPIDGQILIDNQDLKEYDLKSWRKAISVLGQDDFLFNKSVAYNVTYGLQNVSELDLITATKKANAYEFISQLPQGLATEIGDRGIRLSPGQKIRIAIARAFLRDPDILILDEVTNSLNMPEAKLVQEAIQELCHNRTTLIVTNQLSTIKNVYQIVMLYQGKVIEVGTHEELLQNANFYSRWYSMQLKNSQQSRQQKLVQKIAKKLTNQNNSSLSAEIRQNINSLLHHLHLVNEGLFRNDQEEEQILDETYQSAKNMLANLREYERKISQGFDNN
ncbi:ABC transporter ATP-binding protein [Pleurocapsa sp. PCC 7319]|uniref:ABC transporter ATP-binding protein n=1 Tax=Pleurocapsa sp. PCC 7319 TaxID=118161 RepID=UPI00037D485B|nr:ABC transporter ATP-binding protein [Pleurocapsa sp. PCC 7319]